MPHVCTCACLLWYDCSQNFGLRFVVADSSVFGYQIRKETIRWSVTLFNCMMFGMLMVDPFVIPDGELFDQAIIKCTGNSMRQYRYHLKKMFFKPRTKTKEQIYEAVPDD
ncbi:uncharacterized protein LOC141589960 [Silene latifolia]|uniref:uncharacterized protein LOC141589960 n=1 Tax=Silene latifolia TaxID=37657 RepID=UPI003D77486A